MTADERRLDDPLQMIEHVLSVLRDDRERDFAIEALIQDLEDERAALVADRLRARPGAGGSLAERST